MLDITVSGTELAQHLRTYTLHILALSLIIALVTGSLVFAALDQLLVRPMRILTASIVGFRHAPEQDGQDDLIWLAGRGEDEISRAASELKLLQDEMRAALWRNARLAAVGTAVAKISHDLRNILSSALLVADRLQESEDPTIKRAARTLIPAVERAAQLVSRTVDFAREGPPAIIRSSVVLHDLVDETALALRPDDGQRDHRKQRAPHAGSGAGPGADLPRAGEFAAQRGGGRGQPCHHLRQRGKWHDASEHQG